MAPNVLQLTPHVGQVVTTCGAGCNTVGSGSSDCGLEAEAFCSDLSSGFSTASGQGLSVTKDG